MCFRKDLAFGVKYQEIAKTKLPEGEVVVECPEGNFKPYDFKTNMHKYEVKSDRLAHKYGCATMFIEFECNGKDSGIASTEADFWFYFMVKPDDTYVLYEIPITTLKDRCLNSRIICGGDGGKVRGYIVPVMGLEKYKLT